ncbi:MAG: hypothetical protein Q8T11_01190 [Elusimicrobiota bacterium]|nr:hypothetical protein [Elusimicrobiota bacterium]
MRLILFGSLSFVCLGWTVSVRLFPDAFPLELPSSEALGLLLSSTVLGAAAFAAARGRDGLVPGLAFGLLSSAVGWCASRWPQLARAVELCGGVFLGIVLTTSLTSVLALSHAALAAALVREDWRPWSRRALLGLAGAWALATFGADAALTRVWGFGPRSLAAAAGVPTNREADTLAVAWLSPSDGRAYRVDARRMSSETTDLSRDSIDRLEDFLARSGYRGVFASEALAAVRLGRLQWWDSERALDALTLSVPGRAHPDYLRALELLRAGPVTAERYAQLERLAAATGRRVQGFEKAGDAQRIFEGFSAAYARFGDEAKAREWLLLLDGLWAVSEKRIEVGALEELKEGRVDGAILLDDAPAPGLRVGLFAVWHSSATQTTHYWLSGSREPAPDGRFSFDRLGPGPYVLALLGRPDDLRGSFSGVPGVFEVTYERPEVLLNPVRLRRGAAPPLEPFGPAGLPEARVPRAADPPPPARFRR